MLVGTANSANANHAILVVISYCNNTAGTSIEAIRNTPTWRQPLLARALLLTQTFSHTAQGDKPVDGQLQKPFPAFLSDAGSGVEIFLRWRGRCAPDSSAERDGSIALESPWRRLSLPVLR